MAKAIIDCVKDYMEEYNILSEFANIKVDYLDTDSKNSEAWSLEPINVQPILKRNVLGTKTERQSQFVIASRFFLNPIDAKTTINNILLLENVAQKIIQNDIKGIYPTLNDGETVTSMEVISSPVLYAVDKSGTIGRYQMSVKILYDKKES